MIPIGKNAFSPFDVKCITGIPGFTNRPLDGYVSQVEVIVSKEVGGIPTGAIFVERYEKERELYAGRDEHPGVLQFKIEYKIWGYFMGLNENFPGGHTPGGSILVDFSNTGTKEAVLLLPQLWLSG